MRKRVEDFYSVFNFVILFDAYPFYCQVSWFHVMFNYFFIIQRFFLHVIRHSIIIACSPPPPPVKPLPPLPVCTVYTGHTAEFAPHRWVRTFQTKPSLPRALPTASVRAYIFLFSSYLPSCSLYYYAPLEKQWMILLRMHGGGGGGGVIAQRQVVGRTRTVTNTPAALRGGGLRGTFSRSLYLSILLHLPASRITPSLVHISLPLPRNPRPPLSALLEQSPLPLHTHSEVGNLFSVPVSLQWVLGPLVGAGRWQSAVWVSSLRAVAAGRGEAVCIV